MIKLRHIFTVLVIIFLTGINYPWMVESFNTADMIGGNAVNQIMASVIYLIVLGMLVARWKYAVRISAHTIMIWIVISLVFASCLWSEEPSLTLRRAAGLFGTTLIGLYIAYFYDQEQFTKIAGWSFLVINLLSLLVIIFMPDRGNTFDPYGWKGIYFQKNGLGKMSLFGIILFPALLSGNRKRLHWIIGLALSFILLIGSRSTTSLLLTGVVLILWSTILALKHKSKISTVILIFVLEALFMFGMWIYLTNSVEIFLGLFGKNTTLTNRTGIWTFVLDAIRQRPWFGYGYGAFWLGQDSGPASAFWKLIPEGVINAHNGYLDICLQIGIIGTMMFAVFLITILIKWLLSVRIAVSGIAYVIWPIVFLIVFLFYNLTESSFLLPNSMPWVFMSVFAFRSLTKGKSRAMVVNRRWAGSSEPLLSTQKT